MSDRFVQISVKNYRSLSDISLDLNDLNVFFGPNGAGKSSLLDTIWFLRDCALNGVEKASASRNHGIGLLWDAADQDAALSITLSSKAVAYQVNFRVVSGRIDSYVSESLFSKIRNTRLIHRKAGSTSATFYQTESKKEQLIELREPEKLSIIRYMDFDSSATEVIEFNNLLKYIRFFHSRSLNLYDLRKLGSAIDQKTALSMRAENLWSVLQNLSGRRSRDARYATIIHFMQKAFPSFKELIIEVTGPGSVYCSFDELSRREPVRASGASDGHLQLLILLTALFSEGPDRYSLILFDEPEISLHPWAISVFAEAAKLASEKWSKHLFIATHSPVLVSQFQPDQIFAAEIEQDHTIFQRVSEIDSIQDLLQEYATGSLYMAELLAPQSRSEQTTIEPLL